MLTPNTPPASTEGNAGPGGQTGAEENSSKALSPNPTSQNLMSDETMPSDLGLDAPPPQAVPVSPEPVIDVKAYHQHYHGALQHLQQVANTLNQQALTLTQGLPELIDPQQQRSIYELTPAQQKTYLTELNAAGYRDTAQAAAQALQQYQERIEHAKAQQAAIQKQFETLEGTRHVHEWHAIRDAFLAQIPTLATHQALIEDAIETRLAKDPNALTRSETLSGKRQLLHEVLQSSGLYQQLQKNLDQHEQLQLPTASALPMAPDGQVKSKKVALDPLKRVWTRAEIGALSQKQFQALESEIDKALIEGRIQ